MSEDFRMTSPSGLYDFKHHDCARVFRLAHHPKMTGLACPYCGKHGEIIAFQTDLVAPIEIWKDGSVRTHHRSLTEAEAPKSAERFVDCRHCGEKVVLYERAGEDRGTVCPTCHEPDAFSAPEK
jgi:DNA-directed RNA polymerase subunit RPC12/RpoP